MAVDAERSMSAPPEVVFSTATDPQRLAAWLPDPLRHGTGGPEPHADGLRARWSGPPPAGWSAELTVAPVNAGGATARLRLDTKAVDQPLGEIADTALANLASEVAENLTAG